MRANWKGWLKLGEVTCAVALYTAASTSERVAFHLLNRQTGHRLQRQFVDEETDAVVEADEQVKGFELSAGDYVMVEPAEIAATLPASDKQLEIAAFVSREAIDERTFDRPYYLTPADAAAQEAFALIRDGMAAENVAAIARTVLFRRMRPVLIAPAGRGLIATTLDFADEIRSAEDAFDGLPDGRVDAEMRDLARHIIETKTGRFDPAAFDDRYDAALAELVKAKIAGRKPKSLPKPPRATAGSDLLEALRASAAAPEVKTKSASARRKPATAKPRKAG